MENPLNCSLMLCLKYAYFIIFIFFNLQIHVHVSTYELLTGVYKNKSSYLQSNKL